MKNGATVLLFRILCFSSGIILQFLLDLYPERKQLFKSSISKILKFEEGREQFDKFKCEENVYECVKKSPLVKIMMGALRSAGW